MAYTQVSLGALKAAEAAADREGGEGGDMMDSTRIPINWPDTDNDFSKDMHTLVILHLPMN